MRKNVAKVVYARDTKDAFDLSLWVDTALRKAKKGVWHHIVIQRRKARWRGSKWSLFVNGNCVAESQRKKR